jgi:precorrin-6Y C5,15-methyltransferase (decarboxylating)
MVAAADVHRIAPAAAVRVAQDAAMNRIVVVGIGADGVAGVAPASRDELTRATVVYGSSRQLGLLDDTVTAERRHWPSPLMGALDSLRDIDGDVHVVASGDPMLHGVGRLLIRVFGADQVTVLPHVSSVTLACTRLGWAVQDTEVISLMTADPHSAVRRGGQAVVLCRDGAGPAALSRLLADGGRGDSELSVLEQLGGPAERRRDATARDWAANPPGDVDDLNVVAVRYLPDDSRLSVLPDDAFAHDGQITKQSMRAVTLAALAPRTGELLWDVGAGSGSIAIEWCRSGSRCRAVAFERDEQRRKRIAENALAHGADVDVRGEAQAAFDEAVPSSGGVDAMPRPSAIFIGGGLTQPGLLEACYERLPAGGRLVVNAVTAESEAVLAQWYSRVGGELRRFQHYRGEPVGGFTGWRPAMPVTQWVVTKR